MTSRVQIPAYSDAWMKGDRYGEVTKVTQHPKTKGIDGAIAHVKLDISGRTVKVWEKDCTYV